MDEPLNPEQERDALAAELALGVLDGQERADALRLMLRDGDFAALVRDWEDRMAPMHGQVPDAVAPESVWQAVAARIDAPAKVSPLQRRVRFWQAGAFGSGAVAAALALLLVTRPAVVVEPDGLASETVAVARLESADAGPVVLARYDEASAVMTLRIDGFQPDGLAPELWVIPEGGTPVSLGQIDRSGTASLTMPALQRPLLRDGATLAITLEQVSAVPHAAPTSAPVAAGKISII